MTPATDKIRLLLMWSFTEQNTYSSWTVDGSRKRRRASLEELARLTPRLRYYPNQFFAPEEFTP